MTGGRRLGAGRPRGSGKYGEPTVPVRVPVSVLKEVAALTKRAKIPLYVIPKEACPALSTSSADARCEAVCAPPNHSPSCDT